MYVGNVPRRLGLAAGLIVGTAIATVAEEQSTNRVGGQTDWSVFVEDDPKECWGVSAPKETVNTRGGRVVAVNRGDILLFVFFRPGAEVDGQVTFTGGYPFAAGSTVNLNVDGTEFELTTIGTDDPATPGDEREWAWPASPAEDALIIAAMKRGSEAVLTGQSTRGTTTKDTFSLFGFTHTVEDAEKRCAEG